MIILRENECIVSKPNEVSEIFNLYYLSLSKYEGTPDSLCDLSFDSIIQKHVLHPSINLIKRYTSKSASFHFNPVNVETVQKYISKLALNKSPGYDGIQSKFWRLSGASISASLCDIFNQCIINCHFPSNMKLSEISPIFKKNDSLMKENYRSVNILTALSKVFERILSDQLVCYFEDILSS